MKKQGLGILLSVCLLAGSLSGCGKAEEKDYYGQGVAQRGASYSMQSPLLSRLEKEQPVGRVYRGLKMCGAGSETILLR